LILLSAICGQRPAFSAAAPDRRFAQAVIVITVERSPDTGSRPLPFRAQRSAISGQKNLSRISRQWSAIGGHGSAVNLIADADR
jgi:hypothetical protein